MKRALCIGAGFGATILTAIFVPVAAATQPTQVDFSGPLPTVVLTDICSFPVTFTGTITGTRTFFFDQDSNLVRRTVHATEQDTFTANGITLTGLPYTFSTDRYFENGVLVKATAQGLQERVPLPDGSIFFIAGRNDEFGGFALTVNHGTNGDFAALCAALSP
jgi:hypothetical protein